MKHSYEVMQMVRLLISVISSKTDGSLALPGKMDITYAERLQLTSAGNVGMESPLPGHMKLTLISSST